MCSFLFTEALLAAPKHMKEPAFSDLDISKMFENLKLSNGSHLEQQPILQFHFFPDNHSIHIIQKTEEADLMQKIPDVSKIPLSQHLKKYQSF